jgi:Tfp pilus assembly protein PilX
MVTMKKCSHLGLSKARGSRRESGIALIMALICLFVISTLAVGVMYSTQSEIWTTANYRASTQARYLAEAGAQQALNYLQTTFATPPTGFTAANFAVNTMPIMYPATTATTPVIFATSGISSKYADTYATIDSALGTGLDAAFKSYFSAAVTQTAYSAMAPGCSASTCPHFDVAAQLLTAVQTSSGAWQTRWKIVSEGQVNSVGGKAFVQVVEVVDNVTTTGSSSSSSTSPTYSAGVFATGTGCGAITMSGGQYTNSYNSAAQPGVTSPTLANAGGDVATYGNVTITNGAYIIGNVFTPFYNVGATGTYGISGGPIWPGLNAPQTGPYSYGSPPPCSTATGGTEWAVYEDNSGSSVGCTAANSGSCSQKSYALPSPAPSYPTPIMPTVAVNTAACSGYNGICSGGSGGGNGCAVSIPPSTLPNGSAGSGAANFGTVTFAACAVVQLAAGTYNMDSLNITAGAQIKLPATGTVVINILDNGTATTPLTDSGGIVANNGGSPGNLTFVYAGTKPITLNAGANMFATVYAPNSPVTVTGNSGLYGALVAKTATFQGSGHVIYDTNLANQKWNVNTGSTPTSSTGALHVDEFSWSAF